VVFEDVRHMVMGYVSFFGGSDGMLKGINGPIQKVGAVFGKGAFHNVDGRNILEELPYIDEVDQEPIHKWREEDDDKLKFSPN
jgi:hypothetical protein